MPLPLLAARLYVPDDPAVNLAPFIYRWIETVTEDVVDLQGNVVLKEDGSNEITRREVPHLIETHRLIRTGFGDYLSLPLGEWGKLRPFVRQGYQDLRPVPPLGFRLRLYKHVKEDQRWADQDRMVAEWAASGGGIVKADTGAGKTIVGIAAVARLGLRTLVVSKRRDAMPQWEDEFRRHTNITRLEEQAGQKLLGRVTKKKDPPPISFATVQSFLSPGGWQRLIDLQDYFGLIIADEAHELGSPEFARVLSGWNPLCWLGLTATPERKDHRHHVVYSTVGPVVSTGTAHQMPPTVTFIETEFTAPSWLYSKPFPGHYRWNKILEFISKDESRQKLIVHFVEQDIDNGRLVVVYAERRALIRDLEKCLRQDGYRVAYADGDTHNRQRIYDDMRQRKYQVLCAGKVMDALVNIPELDCLHLATPVNQAKQVKQIYGRTRRFLDNKCNPLIRDYADSGGQLSGAYRNRQRVCEEEGWKVQVIKDRTIGVFAKWSRPRK